MGRSDLSSRFSLKGVRTEGARLARAFGYAGRGVRDVWRTQANARWHALATGGVALAAWVCHVQGAALATLVLSVGFVWSAEAFNTALEALADRCSRAPDPLIARAKDAAAGAVLLAALSAVGVALAIFGPCVLALLSDK